MRLLWWLSQCQDLPWPRGQLLTWSTITSFLAGALSLSSSVGFCSITRSSSSSASLENILAQGNTPSSLFPGELWHTFFSSHSILLLAPGVPSSSYDRIQLSIINTGIVLHHRHEGRWANLWFETPLWAGNWSFYTVLFAQVLRLFVILEVHPNFAIKVLWVTVLNSPVETRPTNLCFLHSPSHLSVFVCNSQILLWSGILFSEHDGFYCLPALPLLIDKMSQGRWKILAMCAWKKKGSTLCLDGYQNTGWTCEIQDLKWFNPLGVSAGYPSLSPSKRWSQRAQICLCSTEQCLLFVQFPTGPHVLKS